MKQYETEWVNSGDAVDFTLPEPLEGGEWLLKVVAIDEMGAESEEATRVFVVNRPPAKPEILLPHQNEIVDKHPTLLLKTVDPENQKVKFKITVVKVEGRKANGSVATETSVPLKFNLDVG